MMPQPLRKSGRPWVGRFQREWFVGQIVLLLVGLTGISVAATDISPVPANRGAAPVVPAGKSPITSTTAGAASPSAIPGPAYTLANLGTPWGDSSEANGVNASGQVVGWIGTATGTRHAFLYSKGQMQDLGTLGGEFSEATAINSAGQVVGKAGLPAAAGAPHSPQLDFSGHVAEAPNTQAFLFQNGKMQNLGSLGGLSSWASGITDGGQVVGTSTVNATVPSSKGNIPILVRHAFLYRNGKMQDLGEGLAEATGMNAAGLVVGIGRITLSGRLAGTVLNPPGRLLEWQTVNTGVVPVTDHYPNSEAHAVRYRAGLVQDLDTLGGAGSWGYAVNNDGQIVGEARTLPAKGNLEHAFLFTDENRMKDLGSMGARYSAAYAINGQGQIVGCVATGKSLNGYVGQRAFLYRNGKMEDLNQLVGAATISAAGFRVLLCGRGINATGQIAGYGEDLNGHHLAFLLTPTNGR